MNHTRDRVDIAGIYIQLYWGTSGIVQVVTMDSSLTSTSITSTCYRFVLYIHAVSMSVWTGIYKRDIQCELESQCTSLVFQLLTSGHYRTIPSL